METRFLLKQSKDIISFLIKRYLLFWLSWREFFAWTDVGGLWFKIRYYKANIKPWKMSLLLKEILAILTYAYTKQNLRAEVFVSSSLPCSLAKQFETILKYQHNQFITRHARFNWQWHGLIDTLQFYFLQSNHP